MKSLSTIIGASLLLAGCAGSKPPQVITKTVSKVIIPERTMFYCKNLRKYPDPVTLTDKQVAKLIVEMHRRNTECQKNINNLYFFLEEAKKKAEAETEEKK
jgi:PBP1b-binding outer membrane lipoprotein LpoB